MAEQKKPHRNTKTGQVVSNSMEKSVVVAVDSLVRHPAYGKYIRKTRRFMAHDEANECHVGDRVRIEETRPLSRRKRWIVKEILERAKE
jgi:small subunit ribosomal protein S17